MLDILTNMAGLVWPLALLLAWLAGEVGHRWTGLPRISLYAVSGFALGGAQLGVLPQEPPETLMMLANVAFGLILFEAGHRINLHWLKTNRWLGVTSLAEAVLTFAAVYFLASWYGMTFSISAMLAALAMATSPASVVRIINEQASSGQVTERVLHLSVLNSVLAIFTFKIVLGLVVFDLSGSLWQAIYSSGVVVFLSALLGLLFGLAMPALLRLTHRTQQDSTLTFALAVIALMLLAHTLKQSPMLAALTFGLVARHRRIVLSRAERGFGTLGELLTILLFVLAGATLSWQQVVLGFELGLGLIGIRLAAKLLGVAAFARFSGITWRKGLLVGLGMTPLSVFVILMLEQTRFAGIDLMEQLAPLTAAALTLEVLGPWLLQAALRWAHETHEETRER